MADIEGPYKSLTAINMPSTSVIGASESEPAVFYCSYTCHELQDPANHGTTLYEFQLYVDILGECSDDKRVRISMDKIHLDEEHNFTVNTTQFNLCDGISNVTTFEAQIFVSSDTPTLVAKCGVEYFPNGNAARKKVCYSSTTTLAVINTPNDTCSSSVQPTLTSLMTMATTTILWPLSTTQPPVSPTSTSIACVCPSMEPTPLPNNNTTSTSGSEISPPDTQISPSEFGPIVGVLCLIVAIETILLIVFVYVFVKYKKSRGANSDCDTPQPC